MDPDGGAVVTVDGHIYSCWKGKRVRLKDAAHKIDSRTYTHVESDVKLLAGMVGKIPCRLQSTLWLRWRNMHHILSLGQLPMFPDLMLPENEVLVHA
jgi:hypothetical protein